MAKDWARQLYNSKAWAKVRGYVMRRDNYQCQCYKLTEAKDPCGMPAEEVHHIKWLTPRNVGRPEVALNSDNLLSLYGEHHKALHDTQRREGCGHTDCNSGLVFNEDGMLVEVDHGTG